MQNKTLILATRNAHKVTELATHLGSTWHVQSLKDLPQEFPEVEETGVTFLENATLKAVAISQRVEDWVLADDSGLEVDALNGAPGVWSARYAGLPGNDEQNNAKLLAELKRVGALYPEQRRARFQCVLVLAKKGEILSHVVGSCEGIILCEPRGEKGFGYDPLFQPITPELADFSGSMAELSLEQKNRISHRGQALKALRSSLIKIFA